MKSLIALVVAIPLSVELLGACLSIVDARHQTDDRAAAVERLAVPLLVWGFLWWWLGADGWRVLLGGLAFVVAAHVAAFYTLRWMLSRPTWQTTSIDTDEPTTAEERAPATMGIGKGERNLSPGPSTDP